MSFYREKLSRKTKWAHKNLKLWIIVKNQRLNGEIFVEFIFCLPPSSLLSSYVSTIIVVAAQRFFIFVNISIFSLLLQKRHLMNRDDESRSLILAPTNWFWWWSSVGNIISWMSRYILAVLVINDLLCVSNLIEIVISIFHCNFKLLFFGDKMTINAWRQTKNCWHFLWKCWGFFKSKIQKMQKYVWKL